MPIGIPDAPTALVGQRSLITQNSRHFERLQACSSRLHHKWLGLQPLPAAFTKPGLVGHGRALAERAFLPTWSAVER